MTDSKRAAWLPETLYAEDRFRRGVAIFCDDAGRIARLASNHEVDRLTSIRNCALLPGLVNAHSHAFQRVIRGRTEHRTKSSTDTFWTWREMMYTAANRLSPEDIYDASRMAFLEMALTGVTAVGEFHYLHHKPGGVPYEDPNLLSKEVVRAARDVGLRIALLRVAYARSGYKTEINPQQARFIEAEVDTYLERAEGLRSHLASMNGAAWLGLAPHSLRAVPIDYLKRVADFANQQKLSIHMHVAEQPAEVLSCMEEYGRSPVQLLKSEGLLNERFTAVHAIHVAHTEVLDLAQARAKVCACPTTERNLGDGIIPVDAFFEAGVSVSLGSDSQIQIDLLEDARELEYHLRLQKQARSILAPDEGGSLLAQRLFNCATIGGSQSIGSGSGKLEPGYPADFFTVDLNDASLAGASPENLLTNIVFSASRTAVRDVVVGGKTIIKDGRHHDQDEIIIKFKALQERLWQ